MFLNRCLACVLGKNSDVSQSLISVNAWQEQWCFSIVVWRVCLARTVMFLNRCLACVLGKNSDVSQSLFGVCAWQEQ